MAVNLCTFSGQTFWIDIVLFYMFLGIRQTSEPTVWNLASLRDVSKGTKTVNHPMNSIVQADTSETRMLSPSNSKAQFRDYEKRDTRRKSLCFPVLDNCMIPEDSLELGQRLVEYHCLTLVVGSRQRL